MPTRLPYIMKLHQSKPGNLDGKPYRFAIILSRFNDNLGDELFKNTTEALLNNGVFTKNIEVFRVPGALEIPVTAAILAEKKRYNAIIALGVVIKGETPHFEYVSQQCYSGLMDVALQYKVPVIFGVLTVKNKGQAQKRTAKNKLNKGEEYAESAIEMAMLLDQKR